MADPVKPISCKHFLEFLMEYLDGTLSQAQRDEFDLHMAMCPSCVAYLKTYREAVKMGREALRPSDEPVPPDVPEDLVKAILAARRRG